MDNESPHRAPTLWGILARFDSPSSLYHACEAIRDAGYSSWDACTPFPIHGLDQAMGIKPTKLPWLSLCGALTGFICAISFQYWVNVIEYPINFGGKPLASIPAFIPVTFEFTVLLTAFSTFFGLWWMCRLPQGYHPAFAKTSFEAVTDDKFFVMIESSDAEFDQIKTKEFLESLGATLVEELED